MNMKKLGIINLSGTVVVSDPCYDRDVWCMKNDVSVKAGSYQVYVTYSDEKEFGTRVAALTVIHADHLEMLNKKCLTWNVISDSIGVDSGQCGIFDDSIYPLKKGSVSSSPFCNECCNITRMDAQCGILQSRKGVVSSSGFGDGAYKLLSLSHENETVALLLDYDVTKMRDIMKALVTDVADVTSNKVNPFFMQKLVLPFAA